jgi:L-ribulokinase
VERFQAEGVPIRQVIGIGGVSKKSPFVMQTLANVLNTPIKIVKSEQACALGAAICAATAAGIYANMDDAKRAMNSGFDETFLPEPSKVVLYDKLYQRYLAWGDFAEKQEQVKHIAS